MLDRFAADSVLVLHVAFILFVLLGGLLVVRWYGLIILHVPAVVWAVYVEVTGTICPLTFIENRFRAAAGESGYADGFVEHYLMAVIYPAGLSRPVQFALALLVIVVNTTLYRTLVRSLQERRRPGEADAARAEPQPVFRITCKSSLRALTPIPPPPADAR